MINYRNDYQTIISLLTTILADQNHRNEYLVYQH